MNKPQTDLLRRIVDDPEGKGAFEISLKLRRHLRPLERAGLIRYVEHLEGWLPTAAGTKALAEADAESVSYPRYFVNAHSIKACLQNGSYMRMDKDGSIARYTNGDYLGTVAAIPAAGMVEVPKEQARELLPKCCK